MKAEAILSFIEEIGILKSLPRTGWLIHGIKNGESIADHCYRMTLLSMVLADTLVAKGMKLDTEKVMRLSLLHEIAEARIGDIPFTVLTYIPEEVKEIGERKAVTSMLEKFGSIGKWYQELWEEFEKNETIEAKLVRAADKLELMIQVLEYEKLGYQSLNQFWENDWNQRGFDISPLIQEIMELLTKKRT
ncbi:MAG: HD domain-containing protein [Candidatus Poribacteria bacterium]|nr:HD domain-containing protein [Candidatus Poribacteria bacterium]